MLDVSPFKEEVRWGMGLWVEAETKRLEAAGGQEGDEISDSCPAGRFIRE